MRKNLSSILLILFSVFANAQQNTILIIADDVSTDYFGFYEDAKDTAITPNIRALASQGVRFTRAWANPVCSPTRASMLTGRYPFRTGVGYIIQNNMSAQLDTSEMSIAKLLRSYAPVKYSTACVGKWHITAPIPPKFSYPNRFGFNLYSGNLSGALQDFYSYQRVKNGVADTVNIYATTQTVNDAISWLDTINPSKPFFLWLAFNAPHSPYHKPPDSLITNTGLTGTPADINQHPEKYFKAAIEAMDTEIGRLFQYLSTNNLMDSTNIIFVGDNGNDVQTAQIADSSKAKGTLYDYGVHVPYIISGPAVVNPNRVSDALVSTTDLFATIAELCGFTNWINYIPATKLPVDSKSVLPILKNQNLSVRDWNFTEQFKTPSTPKYGKTIRNLNYHLIRFDNGNEELYNMTLDTLELNNLLDGGLSSTDISNYVSLCDTLGALVGTSNCSQPQGLNDASLNADATIFVSNPVSEFISVYSTLEIKNAHISLFDITGRKLNFWQVELPKYQSVTLDLNGELSTGIYFLIIETSVQNLKLKFIKQK